MESLKSSSGGLIADFCGKKLVELLYSCSILDLSQKIGPSIALKPGKASVLHGFQLKL